MLAAYGHSQFSADEFSVKSVNNQAAEQDAAADSLRSAALAAEPQAVRPLAMKVLLHPGISDLEQTLISTLLAGDDSILVGLRHQFAKARLVERDLTGSGFFLKFAVQSGTTPIEPPDVTIDDVLLDLEGLEHGGGAIAHVRQGYLDLIEGYLAAEAWPADPRLKRVYYDTGDVRDLALLGKVWRERRGKVAP